MSRTLFNISDDLNALAELLTEAEGEVTDEQSESAIDAFFAELGAERDSKLDSYCALIQELQAKEHARAQEAKRLLNLSFADGNAARRLKTRLLAFLQSHDLKKVETVRFKIARQANGGKRPVEIKETFELHPEELPEGLRKVKFSPDLDAIREALEIGLVGDEIGTLKERGEHLRIR